MARTWATCIIALWVFIDLYYLRLKENILETSTAVWRNYMFIGCWLTTLRAVYSGVLKEVAGADCDYHNSHATIKVETFWLVLTTLGSLFEGKDLGSRLKLQSGLGQGKGLGNMLDPKQGLTKREVQVQYVCVCVDCCLQTLCRLI